MLDWQGDYDPGYHKGSIVEQDALAFLGVFKNLEDVPARYYLENHESEVTSKDAWNDYDAQELADLSAHTRRYVYGKAYREWQKFCDEHDVHPALADPRDIEEHLAEQRDEMEKLKTVHDARFRPLFRWYRWMQFHTDYPHRYNPVVMAVLLGGAVHDIRQTRLLGRKNFPDIQMEEN